MADNATARFIKQGQRSSFRATVWAAQLPVIRNERGQAIHALKKVAMVLASHADGETGEGAYPGLQRIADEAWLATKKEAADTLHLGKELGLWTEDEDESEWGTAIWHLAIDDLDLVRRLEEDEIRNQERKRQINADKQARHRARTKGTDEPAPRNPVHRVTPARPVIEVQEAPDAPAPRPNFPRGLPKTPAVPDPEPVAATGLAEQLMAFVLPKLTLTKEESRRAHTTLMKFADRWPNALEIAELGFALAQGQPEGIELGHFDEENDHLYAVPLNARVEAATPAA